MCMCLVDDDINLGYINYFSMLILNINIYNNNK